VLISGPPGIGKTSAAQIVSKAEGFKALEYNASDTRSKKALHDTIQDVLNNRFMAEYHGGNFFKPVIYEKNGAKSATQPVSKSSEKAVIIMDEVDGMSAGDRGGIAELILLIKRSRVPIICICNDRASPRVRSLANYCLDLRFRRYATSTKSLISSRFSSRPDARSIFPRMKEICDKEGLSISPNVVEQLVGSTRGDIRQVLNVLSSWRISRGTLSHDEAKHL
jgi:replication factor C subunit 1